MPVSSLRVFVIGGGAAGMLASIVAAKHGSEVTVLEKNQRIGKKILATGNGRCNLTNDKLQLINFHGKHPEFAARALRQFNVQKTLDFFEYLGIKYKVEDCGKIFPFSDQAASVLDVLRYEMERTGVRAMCQAEVIEIFKKGEEFRIVLSDGSVHQADRVILATGGKAAPQFGSNGSGYMIAKKIGHSIVKPMPALVPLKLNADFLKQIKGIKFVGSAAIIAVNNRLIAKSSGEILFTEYGVSGPPILSLSRTAGEYLQKKREVYLKLTIINHLSTRHLTDYLSQRLQIRPDKSLDFSFVGFINKRLVPVLLRAAGISDVKMPAGRVSEKELSKIVNILQNWRFQVVGTTSWPNAQTTAGGVDVVEVDKNTLESKILSGLYFAGELLDIDGDCGGFNLQWAWSSGYVAGVNAAVM